jgi:hypothetical protein
MTDIPMNGKGKVKINWYRILEATILVLGLAGILWGVFTDNAAVKLDIEKMKMSIQNLAGTVQELVDIHPRTQGGKP